MYFRYYYLCVYYSLAHKFCIIIVFFFKQKTAYEMRISDWSSDVCSSDLFVVGGDALLLCQQLQGGQAAVACDDFVLLAIGGEDDDQVLQQADRKSVV